VPPSVTLLVRSGNADISLTSVVFPAGSAPRLTIAAQLAGMTAMARDVLAALAHPSAVHPETGRPMSPAAPSPSPSAPRPRYAGPKDTCALVKPATLARYGATSTGTPAPGPTASLPPGGPVSGNCGWHLPAGIIFLDVSVYPDSVSAQQAYEFEVQDTHQSGHGVTFDGAQPVKGVGQRATAIAQTIAGASHELTLYVWADNAVIEVSFADLGTPLAGPPTPRSVRLAGDTAIARDVLARLPS
jgi:hypothetical protein